MTSNNHPLQPAIVEAIKTVFDPEIPVDIFELGLIYDIIIDDAQAVKLIMTLTSPMCPVAGSMPAEVMQKVGEVPGVSDVDLELVYDPPWTKDKMSDEAKLELDML